MASSSESSLFNIEKLDGTNFPFWKEQVYNVLVQKKQARPIKLKGVKLEGQAHKVKGLQCAGAKEAGRP